MGIDDSWRPKNAPDLKQDFNVGQEKRRSQTKDKDNGIVTQYELDFLERNRSKPQLKYDLTIDGSVRHTVDGLVNKNHEDRISFIKERLGKAKGMHLGDTFNMTQREWDLREIEKNRQNDRGR